MKHKFECFQKYKKQNNNFFNFFALNIGKYPYICTHNRGYGEIGRRARLRIWCRKACRFESYYPHRKLLNREAFFMPYFSIILVVKVVSSFIGIRFKAELVFFVYFYYVLTQILILVFHELSNMIGRFCLS